MSSKQHNDNNNKYLMPFAPLLLITRVWQAGTMPGLYRKHLPKLNLVKENSRQGSTAVP